MAALVKTKKNVLIPIDDNHRYDLVVDEDGTFNRIQCKAGRMTRRGEIKFNTSSSNKEGGRWKRHDYSGQIESFGVYCEKNDTVYLVPVEDVGKCQATLRTLPTKNSQQKKVRWAQYYEICPRSSGYRAPLS